MALGSETHISAWTQQILASNSHTESLEEDALLPAGQLASGRKVIYFTECQSQKDEGHSGEWSWAWVPCSCIQDILLCNTWHNHSKAQPSQQSTSSVSVQPSKATIFRETPSHWLECPRHPQTLLQLSVRENQATPEALSIAGCFPPLVFKARHRREAGFSFRVKTNIPEGKLGRDNICCLRVHNQVFHLLQGPGKSVLTWATRCDFQVQRFKSLGYTTDTF